MSSLGTIGADNQTAQSLSKTVSDQAAKALNRLKSMKHDDPPGKVQASTESHEVLDSDVPNDGQSVQQSAQQSQSADSFSQLQRAAKVVAEQQAPAPAAPAPDYTQFEAKIRESVQKEYELNQKYAAMEARAQQAEAAAARAQGILDNGADDVMGLAEAAKLNQQDLLEAMANGGKAPVNRAYVKKLEAEQAKLTQRLDQMIQQQQQREQQAAYQSEISSVSSHLSGKPEYSIFKAIPDAPQMVQQELARMRKEAQARGEAASSVTVDKAAGLLKERILGLAKQWLTDDGLRKELGYGEQVSPAEKAPKARKGITGNMSASGNISRTSKGYDKNDRLRRAMSLITKS